MIQRERHQAGEAPAVSVLQLDHGRANALDLELLAALGTALDREVRERAGAVVLTGTGGIFCAGVDLFRMVQGGVDYVRPFIAELEATFRRLVTCPLPVVAAVQGHAIAGGCLLAAACDHRILTDGRAKVGVPELLVGVPFPTAAIELLRGLLPAHVVQDLVLSGRTVAPAEALALGLVDQVVAADQVLPRALARAQALAALPSQVFAITKQQLRAPLLAALDGARPLDEEILAVWEAPDTRARIQTYLDQTVGRKG